MTNGALICEDKDHVWEKEYAGSYRMSHFNPDFTPMISCVKCGVHYLGGSNGTN